MSSAMIPLVALPAAMSFFFALILVAFPLWAISHGANSLDLGLIGAAGSLVYLLSVTFTGRLSDRYNPRRVSTLGSMIFAAAAALFPSTRSLAPIYFLVSLYNFALAIYWPSLESQLAHVLHRGDLSRRTSYYNISWSTGLALGGISSGFIYDLSPIVPFYLAAAGAALLPLLFLVFPPPSDNGAGPPPLDQDRHPLQHPIHLTVARVSNTGLWFALGILRNIFPKLAHDLSISATWLGILMSSINWGMSSIFVLFAFSHFWHFRYRLVVLAQVLALGAMLLVAVSKSPLLFLAAFAIIGLASANSYSGALYYSLHFAKKPGEEEPSTVGHNTGIHEFYIGLGGFLGPLLGGPLAITVSPRAPYLLAGSVILATMLAGWILMRRAARPLPR